MSIAKPAPDSIPRFHAMDRSAPVWVLTAAALAVAVVLLSIGAAAAQDKDDAEPVQRLRGRGGPQ